MKKSALFSLLSLAFVAGCGGFTGPKTANITGSVLDIDFNPVREARVWTIDSETRSSTAGTYQLTSNRPGELKVTAEIVKDGVTYRGSNWALNFDNETTQNVNIIVGPKHTNGKIVGVVRDRDGFLLENVPVYAFNGSGSASRDFTNSLGQYVLEDVIAGVEYTISASARTYRSDTEVVVLDPAETRTINFILGNPGIPGFDPPTNLDAVTWVSHPEALRSPGGAEDPVKNIKRIFDPRFASPLAPPKNNKLQTRGIDPDRLVETDLFWDPIGHDDLLGYGIYRSPGVTTVMNPYDFMSDPLASYYVDLGPNPNSTYSYAVTALATLYPDFNNTESDFSNVVNARTLDLLDLISPTFSPLTFRWLSGSGASEYYVFLFDRFPGIGVDPIWDNQSDPAFGTSYQYDGPGLAPNRTYYFLVLGTANAGSSRTISRIGSFQT